MKKKIFAWREKKGRQSDKGTKHTGLKGYMLNHAINIRSGKSFTEAWRRLVNNVFEK